jgi:hypothetical protein
MILPRLEKRTKSYYVLVTNNHHAWYRDSETGEQVWRRFSNSYGFDYSYRGFAINKARNIVAWAGGKDTTHAVVCNENDIVVWDSCKGLRE